MNKAFTGWERTTKAVLRYVKENPDAKDWKPEQDTLLHQEGQLQEYDAGWNFRNRFGKLMEYKWFKKYGAESDFAMMDTYSDYLYICGRCGHNTKDPYWRYPKDINAAHAKVHAEYEADSRSRTQGEGPRKTDGNPEKERRFKKFAGKFIKDTARAKGIHRVHPARTWIP